MSNDQIPAAETIALFYREGSSDKEYHVHLKARDNGWVVEFQYGKRGSALRSGVKTKDPLDFATAKKTYDKTVQGQLKEGYTPDEGGAIYQSTPLQNDFTGVLPQLLNAVELHKAGDYMKDPDWMLQEKFDGQRLMLRKHAGAVQGINRSGIVVAIPKTFEDALLALPCDSCLIDGEWMGERFAAFDLVERDGDLRSVGAKERKARLDGFVGHLLDSVFLPVETAFDEASKRALMARVRAQTGEGLVGKRVGSSYKPGRPNSGGDQIKLKFVESATMLVSSQHATLRSVGVCGLDEKGVKVEKGSVTIPPNHPIPAVGAVVEILYLYAYKNGSLYQPVYKGARVDKAEADCVLSQLKCKVEAPVPAKAGVPKPRR
jgi:bifunctional non-homologous end joining protein LigD